MNEMAQPPRPPMPQSQPMPNNTLLTATLEAVEWNVVFQALNEMPMRVSRPVFDKLIGQFNQIPQQG